MAAMTTTVVDPVDGLHLTGGAAATPATTLGTWSTAGSYDGWTINNAAASSVDGASDTLLVTTKTDGTTAQVIRSAIAGGPNLDYGYNYFTQVRMSLPSDYVGDVTFSFGTTVKTGFATDRQFTIPAAQLIKDGAFHTYRIDLGLQVWWKDSLRDLRLDFKGDTATAKTIAIDYVEVGDVPNDVFGINTSSTYLVMTDTTVTAATRQKIESKHFVFWYDPAVDPGGRGATLGWATVAHNALHMLEESTQVYSKVLGAKDVSAFAGAGTKNKFNVTSWYPGYFSAGSWLNVDTSGLISEESGNPTPHEFGHVTDTQNGAYLIGGHWESHANWYREQWANWFSPYFSTATQSTFTPIAIQYSNLHVDNSRLIYNDWRVYTPLQNYATSLGLDFNAAAQLWLVGSTNQTIFDKLSTVVSASGKNIKDVVGALMQYWPTLDFPNNPQMKASAWAAPALKAEWNYLTTSYLEPEADRPGWYEVPADRAPEKYAFMTHVLKPDAGSTSISVSFNGLPSTDATADWRWSLQAVGADGVTRYSPLYGNGATGTLAILPTDTRVMLVVTATPGNTSLDLDRKHNTKQDTQDADRLIYPYEISITGGTPATGTDLRIGYARTATGKTRVNPDGSPSGWVDSTATVAASVYIAPGAQVLGSANVSGNARILDFATVSGNAVVSGNAIISGYAVVKGGTVTGNARIRDHAMVGTNTTVSGNAVVEQFAFATGAASALVITDNAVVRGVATPNGGTLYGSAIAEYDYTFNWTMGDGTHANNYPFDAAWYDYYEATQVKPRGLLGSYRVNEAAGSFLFDEFGTLNAELRGTATRVNDASRNSNVLSLDGASKYALLDRSLAELIDGTYALSVNPTGTSTEQPILYFGSGANAFKLVARDADGFAHLTITVNGVTQQLVSTAIVPLDTWTTISLTFTGGVARFYINGALAGSAAMSLKPNDVLTNDARQTAEAVYLGRDGSGNFFSGKLDDIRVYNVALTAAEIADEAKRVGAILGNFNDDAIKTYSPSNITLEQSGVHDGLIRTISAWINPATSPTVANSYYQPIADSSNERRATGDANYNMYGSGLGISGGKLVARLDGFGMWATGVPITVGQWQQVTLTFDGSIARIYLNGVLRGTQAYTGTASGGVAGKNYRIGWGQRPLNNGVVDATTRTYFDGKIYDLTISDRVVAPSVGMPLGWTGVEIGTGGSVGYSSASNGLFAITGSGAGITGTSDRFQYAYTNAAGDSSITAYVTTPVALTGNVAAAALAGLTIRSNTAANAPEVTVAITPTSGVVLRYRTASGATTTAASVTGISGPIWLRLSRSTSNGVSAFYSTDGVNFTQIGTTLGAFAGTSVLPSSALVGFAVASTSANVLGQATFNQVSITSSAAPTIVNPASASALNGNTVDLSVLATDPSGEAGLTYQWAAVGNIPGPVTFTANGSNAAKNTSATFLAAGTYNFVVSVFDSAGQVISSSTVSVTITATLVAIAPATGSVLGGGTQQFSAVDQFGGSVPTNLITWTASAGAISASGLFNAPVSGGNVTISATMAGSPTQTAVVSIVAPVAQYKNDAIVAGNTTVADSSGNGRNGTLSATTGYSSTTGKIGTALTLSGASVTLPNSVGTVIGASTSITIAAWFNLTALNNWARLFDFGTGTSRYMFLAPYDGSGRILFAITNSGNGAEQQLATSITPTVGTWTHVAVTIAGSTGTLFVNGVAVATNTGMTLNPASLGTTTQNYIGKSQFGDPNLLGSIDDFRIYNTAASSDTIAAIYAAGNAAATSAPTAVSATAISATQVNLTWTDNATIETGYLIERATNAAFTTGLKTVTLAPNTSSYSDTTVVGSTTYYYRVTTLLAGGITVGPVSAGVVTTPTANAAPTVATPASSTPVTPNTAALNILGADDNGEAGLTYTWSINGTQPGSVSFGANGSNSAKQSTATFGASGVYHLLVTITDAGGLSTTSTLDITVTLPAVVSSSHLYNVSPNQIQFVFNSDTGASAFGASSLTVLRTDGTPVAVTGTVYSAATFTWTFTLATSIANGNYTATLAHGTAIDADASVPFFVLAGDINHDRAVNFDDLLTLARHYNQTGQTFSEGNLDYDAAGLVGFDDLLILARAYGATLAAPALPATASVATSTRKRATVINNI